MKNIISILNFLLKECILNEKRKVDRYESIILFINHFTELAFYITQTNYVYIISEYGLLTPV